jgi:hypothetical protein
MVLVLSALLALSTVCVLAVDGKELKSKPGKLLIINDTWKQCKWSLTSFETQKVTHFGEVTRYNEASIVIYPGRYLFTWQCFPNSRPQWMAVTLSQENVNEPDYAITIHPTKKGEEL